MELWQRYLTGNLLECDQRIQLSTEAEWRLAIHDPNLISSVLWPTPPLFKIAGSYLTRRHPHEKGYLNNPNRNQSYRETAQSLAIQLQPVLTGKNVLVYAPLRGALPIWRAVRQYLKDITTTTYYPVTSSFVFYPEEFKIRNQKGRNASGRYNNILELRRIQPFLKYYDCLLYIDEIVSGGMIHGYIADMIKLEIYRQIPIYAAGLADCYGERSHFNRNRLLQQVIAGNLRGFFWAGCQELITEDQKFLLGIHYADYRLGPHIIPLFDEDLNVFLEKRQFEADVMNFEATSSNG